MENEKKYMCDAKVMKEPGLFNYLKFIISDRDYSRFLQSYSAGQFVEIYIKEK